MKRIKMFVEGEGVREVFEADEVDAERQAVREAVRKCFGKTPISCGALLVNTDSYDDLARLLNKQMK